MKNRLAVCCTVFCVLITCGLASLDCAVGHEHSLEAFLKARQAAAKGDGAQPSAESKPNQASRGVCNLTIELRDSRTNKPLPGLVRIIDRAGGKPVRLSSLIARDENWYAMSAGQQVVVPQARLTIEALHGLQTELGTREVDLTDKKQASVTITLKRFFNASQKGLYSGNTHLHIMKRTHAEAVRYLRVVPQADGLDLVYLSHLRRIPDERHYISNGIVERSLQGGELQRLSRDAVLLRPGQEHRHNFGGYDEGYGHVMFLDIKKLVRPVSIGPGIMQEGTDGIPLQRGIREAHHDEATVVWCHNKFGLEDIPNWMSGLLDAQNIFDGGTHGSYQDTFYRYLNLGMRVPFSTGTDWFIYDFSRVYCPIEDKLSSKRWLTKLAEGRSFITNGPLLELEVDGRSLGDTIELPKPKRLNVTARAVGRVNFNRLQLVQNGDVVHSVAANAQDGHFLAQMKHTIKVDSPGWFALRISIDAGKNEFGRQLFAHTSPIYVELAGKRIFQNQIARELVKEIEQNIATIKAKGKFANDSERQAVLGVHRRGVEVLRKRIAQER